MPMIIVSTMLFLAACNGLYSSNNFKSGGELFISFAKFLHRIYGFCTIIATISSLNIRYIKLSIVPSLRVLKFEIELDCLFSLM